MGIAKFIPLFPAIAMVVCGLLGTQKALRRYSAAVTIAGIAVSFVLVLMLLGRMGSPAAYLEATSYADRVVNVFDWIHAGAFAVNFSFFIDPLTMIMLLVITGIGLLIAIYASGYMAGDPGYFRFFAYVALFIFAMMCVVMADNLVLLYLGWEGVGAASYLLIGFYYKKPSAVAAAKKAFIVNRIGDLGFALGIMTAYLTFGSVQYQAIIPAAQAMLGQIAVADLSPVALAAYESAIESAPWMLLVIPFFLMTGAIGKSAQLPLYVWLPDAMEGPTPVSALIHAATMVTSGVYMISRLLPVFELSPYALPTVAIIGASTALFGATIAICQTDLKRVWAFSTVSQLGYMFLGVGVMSTFGGMFHLVNHAFFKALLFLTAGSVMHALAGQLDLRKMSGLRSKMPITAILMLCGCLSLAGFPFTAGFISKDAIIAEAYIFHPILGLMGLVTALFTATYAFRLWFRVFLGPTEYEMGEEHGHGHGHEEDHGHGEGDSAKPQAAEGITVEHHHEPHEMSWLMNGPLVVLALGALFSGVLFSGSVSGLVEHSTASVAHHDAGHPKLLGMDVHLAMMIISSVIALGGIALAAYLHWFNRPAADALARRNAGLVRLLANKYYVDEIYAAVFYRPLRLLGEVFFVIDRLIIDGCVMLVGLGPRLMGLAVQPAQSGRLQGYGLGMAAGAAGVILLIVLLM